MNKPEAERLYDSGKDLTVVKLIELESGMKNPQSKNRRYFNRFHKFLEAPFF
ncbi:MAG: hypothetical protein ABSF52_06125 [Syntrophobacteraceae bacterium]